LFLSNPIVSDQTGNHHTILTTDGTLPWQYRRNQHRVVERMMAKYGRREKENIYLIPAYVNMSPRFCYNVHPSADGYRQMANSLYYWVKGILAEK